ncbi:MAG: sulfate ABC transporter substrate-binding protein [Planctomycetaceae bacterium]|jgi:sulfate transport system substrate-binding protein|nr:sulfate ABC transporter substrate-binding protein [Planctomycetaceae bacterium]
MKRCFTILILAVSVICGICVKGCGNSSQKREILNVSYDPTRELYKAINSAFEQKWQQEKGEKIEVKQSHGGSGKQSRSVITGNEADVVTLALGYDIDVIHENADLLPEDWQKRLPNNSCPYTSMIIFLVRKGNPKHIRDWDDLLKDNVTIVTPNPQTSGGARWNYLAAWGYILKKELGDFSALHDSAKTNEAKAAQAKAFEFVKKLFNDQKSPAKATGARGATQQFARNGEGDVLLAWENEALLFLKDGGEFEIVTPSISILAEPPVALVDKNVEKKETRDIAEAYLNFLYEPVAQEIIAKNFYRPTNPNVMAKYANQFKPVELFTIDNVFGSWNKAQKEHFSSGGTYEKVIEK